MATNSPTTEGDAQPDGNGAAPAAPADGAAPKTESTPAEGDAPPASGAETDEGQSGDGQAEPTGAPETYQFEAPEGSTIDLGGTGFQSFQDLCREQNRSNAEGQAFLNLFCNEIASMQEQAVAAWENETKADWTKKVEADSELGGDVEAIKGKMQIAQLALAKFADADAQELFQRFRLGNHPAFLRILYRVGLTLREDTSLHRGTDTTTPVKTAGQTFYPNMNGPNQ